MYFSNFNQCSLGKNYFEIREYLGQRVFKLISSEIKRKLMQFFFIQSFQYIREQFSMKCYWWKISMFPWQSYFQYYFGFLFCDEKAFNFVLNFSSLLTAVFLSQQISFESDVREDDEDSLWNILHSSLCHQYFCYPCRMYKWRLERVLRPKDLLSRKWLND